MGARRQRAISRSIWILHAHRQLVGLVVVLGSVNAWYSELSTVLMGPDLYCVYSYCIQLYLERFDPLDVRPKYGKKVEISSSGPVNNRFQT